MRENHCRGSGVSQCLRFKLLLDTGITLFALVGLKAIAFVTLCLHFMILHPIGLIPGLGSGDRPESLGIGPRVLLGKGSILLVTLGLADALLSFFTDPRAMLREGEVEGIAASHGFDCRSVCACQCRLKRHGVIFRCFSSKSFISMWSTCKMRRGDTLSPHDRLLAVRNC